MCRHFVALRAKLLDFHLLRMFLLISRTIVCFFTTLGTFESDKLSRHLYLPPFTLTHSNTNNIENTIFFDIRFLLVKVPFQASFFGTLIPDETMASFGQTSVHR